MSPFVISIIMRILGLDISSTTIGYCILDVDKDSNIKFILCNYIKPIKDENIIERLANTRDKIKEIIDKHKPTHIGIENIVEFMKNQSQSKTIITLSVFNRMIGLLAYDFLGHSPSLFNVLTIRHGIKLSKALPKKEEIPELVAKILNIKFPYIYKKNGKPMVENEDMADSIAVALYYAFQLTGKIKRK